MRYVILAAWLCVTGGPALATPYWVNYDPVSANDPNELPEFSGWERQIANGGAERWIEDGCLVIDSRSNSWIEDMYLMSREIDCAPGELFLAEWRLRSAITIGYFEDGVGIYPDGDGDLFFLYRSDNVYSVRENWHHALSPPGTFHSYRLESSDMLNYRLWIDDEFVRDGYWDAPSGIHSLVTFGDQSQAAFGGALSYWDYVRFGVVVPEPATVLASLLLVVGCVGRQR